MKRLWLWIGCSVALILTSVIVLPIFSPVNPWLRERKAQGQTEDEDQIRENVEKYVVAVSTGDLESAKSLCTEKAITESLGTIESAKETLKGYNWSQKKYEMLTSITESQIEVLDYQPDSADADAYFGGHGGAGIISFALIRIEGKWVIDEVMWVGCD